MSTKNHSRSPQIFRTFKMKARGQRRKASSLEEIFDLQKAEYTKIRQWTNCKIFLASIKEKRIGIMDWNGFTRIPFSNQTGFAN